jgi:hypothetical protein
MSRRAQLGLALALGLATFLVRSELWMVPLIAAHDALRHRHLL